MATTKSNSTHDLSSPDPLLFLAGRNLAVVVLDEMLQAGNQRCSIEDARRKGLTQCNALARAIGWLHDAPPEVIQGFAAVFTDRAGNGAQISPTHFGRLTIEQMGVMPSISRACH